MKSARSGLVMTVLLAIGGATWAQSASESASGKVFQSKDQSTIQAALWEENGQPMIARGTEAVSSAPSEAIRVTVRIFGTTGIREVIIPGGSKFLPPKGPNDTVVYLLSGRMTATLGDTVSELVPGDVLQKSGSAYNVYEFHEDSVIVEHYVPSP